MPPSFLSRIRPTWLGLTLLGFTFIARGQSFQADTVRVNALLAKGEALQTQHADSAALVFRQAFDLARRADFTRGYFEGMRNLTYALNNLGRHDEAKAVAREALRRAERDTSNRNRGLAHFALAVTAMMQGDPKEATAQYERAAECMRRINHRQNLAVISQNLGLLYEEQRLYPQALRQFNRALNIDRGFNDSRSVAIDLFSIGTVYSKMGNPKAARDYYFQARQRIDPRKDLDFLVNLYNNIGDIYSNEARYDSATYYQRKALDLSRQLKNPRHEMHLLMAMAKTLNRQGRYGEAKRLLDQSHRMAKQTDAGLMEFKNIYREYAVTTVGLGDYEAALGWVNRHGELEDSLRNTETKELLERYELKIKQADARQNLVEKQRRIERLEDERKRQNLWLGLAGVSVAAGLGLLAFGFLYFRQKRQADANALLALQHEQALVAMRAELQGQQKERVRISKEMHDDLGASLTAIGLLSEVMKTRPALAASPEVHKISELSADMVTAMNEIIWALNTRNDSLNGLVAYVRQHAREFLENTALALRIEADEVPEEVSIGGDDRRHVFLTVKEALNNAVKHAQATAITLRMKPGAQALVVEVCDNGRGFSPHQQHGLRNGLQNMQNRMREAGGSCEISSGSGGTCVKLTYPYRAVPSGSVPPDKILQT